MVSGTTSKLAWVIIRTGLHARRQDEQISLCTSFDVSLFKNIIIKIIIMKKWLHWGYVIFVLHCGYIGLHKDYIGVTLRLRWGSNL